MRCFVYKNDNSYFKFSILIFYVKFCEHKDFIPQNGELDYAQYSFVKHLFIILNILFEVKHYSSSCDDGYTELESPLLMKGSWNFHIPRWFFWITSGLAILYRSKSCTAHSISVDFRSVVGIGAHIC